MLRSFILASLFLLSPTFGFARQTTDTQSTSKQTAHKKTGKQTLELNPQNGNTEFYAIGKPSALKVHGTGPAPSGSFTIDHHSVKGTAIVELAPVTTGIEMRDRHLRDKYLDVKKYPEAKLSVTDLSLPEGVQPNQGYTPITLPFKGKLQLHGQEKPVTGTITTSADGKTANITAQFKVKISDYDIPIPTYAGVTIADSVDVTVHSTATIDATHRSSTG